MCTTTANCDEAVILRIPTHILRGHNVPDMSVTLRSAFVTTIVLTEVAHHLWEDVMTPAPKSAPPGRARARFQRAGLVSALVLALTALFWASHPASAAPPAPPGVSTTRAHLATLTVAAPHPMTGYSRDKFPHWHTVTGTCNTRETVLKRDGTGVTVNAACTPTAGKWYSIYDKLTFTDASDIDIDHIVALANAWRSGADDWTTAEREEFANDLSISQLVAVSASSNRSKGDQSPDQWLPANTAHWCLYARRWIDVKYQWDLNITSAEKTTLTDILDEDC